MEQKQRNKIAWGLAVVLAPLLIYLLMTNVFKVRKAPAPPPPAAITTAAPVGAPPVLQPSTPTTPQIDPKVLAEQKRIAALLPRSNPFNPSSRPVFTDSPSPIDTESAILPAPFTAPAPSTAPDTGFKLTAIIGGSTRMAMINGHLYMEGNRIAHWTIIKITDREVFLKDGDRQTVLRLK